ncbi:hypothetical protein RI367_000512, partial [Sorochytrium milnesiophthora]
GSLSAWYATTVPGTTRGYGDGVPANTPMYDVACLRDVITELVTGVVQSEVKHDVYQELLRILENPPFPRNLHEKHAAKVSAPTVARVFWELAERVKALATRENISTIDLEVVKPRPRSD